MTAERLDPRGVAVAIAGIALVMACSSSPDPRPNGPGPVGAAAAPYKRYGEWDKLMENEMQPIQGSFTDELTKDLKDTDYRFLGNWSRKAAYYFTLFSDKSSHLYEEDADERASAEKARAWLLEMAGAADRKEHGTLVRLMGQRLTICTQCHEDQGG